MLWTLGDTALTIIKETRLECGQNEGGIKNEKITNCKNFVRRSGYGYAFGSSTHHSSLRARGGMLPDLHNAI
jgi:hypothetical protein